MTRTIALVSFVVREYDEAIEWFTRCLGFVVVEDTPLGGGKRWVVVSPAGEGARGAGSGAALLLARAAQPEQRARIGDQTGGRVFLFLETDDVTRDHAAMTAQGVRFEEAPREESYGRVAVFLDLYGNRWDLVERSSAR
jgi:catechol 2,3-dioxygenase-like lactoylglutathione lyase family enzyme